LTGSDNRSFVVRELAGRRDLLAVAAAFPHKYPCLLESAAEAGDRARWDILFACTGTALQLDSDGMVRNGGGDARGTRFLEALDAEWTAERVVHPGAPESDRADAPFRGGWVVYLGYEVASEIEPRVDRVPAADRTVPHALALRCPAAILVDRRDDRTLLVAEAGQADLLDELAADLERGVAIPPVPALAVLDEDAPGTFLDGVARVREYLLAGDVFQVNLSRAWHGRFAAEADPASVYAALRRANPAPFAGLLQQPGWAIASSSPERLVEVRGARVQTRPIAGTRPRVAGEDDAERVRELVAHPKERAEHIMLIDLERNDLGRVCVPGSVEVDELMGVESYAHVHHIVSNVRGCLRRDVRPADVIRAVFPGGTITGCPKVRCMQIIAELERVPRCAYTGSLGYLNRDGDLDLNILIRTLELDRDCVRLRAGAGLVVDSDAGRELDETRAKARGLLRALGVES
jgi:anthranilate synthase component 1